MCARPPNGGQPKRDTCPRCGSTRLQLVGTRLDCLDCGLRGAHKAPWTIDRARAFEMPFGKYKGRTVGRIAETGAGRSYLRWAAETLDGNVAMAAAIVLREVESC